MNQEYYMVAYGERRGPFDKSQLMSQGLTPETLVWRAGMQTWQPASTLPELNDLFHPTVEVVEESAFGTYAEVPPMPGSDSGTPTQQEGFSPDPHVQYYAMLGNDRIGPLSPQALVKSIGFTPDTPVWCMGMPEWQPAHTRPDLMAAMQGNSYGYGNGYHQPYQQPYGQQRPTYAPGSEFDYQRNSIPHTNWLPWAIVGTVLGCSSCVGLICGIIGIVQASKANRCYQYGDQFGGDQANSSAKIMTIIALVVAVLSIIGSIILFSTPALSSVYGF